jgi:hypothetical protein
MDHRLDPKPKSVVEAEGANFARVMVILLRDALETGGGFDNVAPANRFAVAFAFQISSSATCP